LLSIQSIAFNTDLVEPLVPALLEHPDEEEGAQATRPREHHPALDALPPK